MKVSLIIFGFVLTSKVFGQDIHFSQFNEMPLNINPALAGNSEAVKRAGLIYRNQWNSVSVPFQSTGVFADYKLTHDKLKDNIIGIGLQVLNDRAGTGSLLQNQLMASINAQRFIDAKKKMLVSVGMQLGFFQKSYDESKLNFATDFAYESASFVSNGANQNLQNTSIIKADLGLGANFIYFNKKGLPSNIGVSFSHLNTPEQSFLGSSDPLKIKTTLQAKTALKIKENLFTYPTLLVNYQNKAENIAIGSQFIYSLGRRLIEDTELKAGVYYRLQDAFFVTLGINHDNWGINFGYDMTSSGLSQAGKNVNAFEVCITIKNKLFKSNNNPRYILPGNRLL